jgi:hypothetical protein
VGAAALTAELGGRTIVTPTGVSVTTGANATVLGVVQAAVPTTILGVVDFNTINVNATSTVGRAMDYIELVLVLDNTGFMPDTLGSGSTTKTPPSRPPPIRWSTNC